MVPLLLAAEEAGLRPSGEPPASSPRGLTSMSARRWRATKRSMSSFVFGEWSTLSGLTARARSASSRSGPAPPRRDVARRAASAALAWEARALAAFASSASSRWQAARSARTERAAVFSIAAAWIVCRVSAAFSSVTPFRVRALATTEALSASARSAAWPCRLSILARSASPRAACSRLARRAATGGDMGDGAAGSASDIILCSAE
mmetsp:Transcript_11753/g.37151  ORF Transcript_11753/g.37151 Transcript_11753/m.37151 type:complete len:206 (+) Transcript_11753:151-768(+)